MALLPLNARFTVTRSDKNAAKHLGIGEMSSFGQLVQHCTPSANNVGFNSVR